MSGNSTLKLTCFFLTKHNVAKSHGVTTSSSSGMIVDLQVIKEAK
jgi:hypothetical protein